MPTNEAQAKNRRVVIENVLHMHPGVREAALVDDGSGGFVAFVVPDDSYMDEALGRGTAGSTVLGKWQKTFDLSQLNKEAGAAPVGFNTIGWNSSYTRSAIPLGDMREWVENTVGDILQLRPRVVCEVGCGTGMLLMQVAPCCDRYVAVDFSPVVLDRLRAQLRTVPAIAERVEVLERKAGDLEGLDENSFDTVVVNSVVQFFPNVAYLTKVLESAISAVKPGGHVFIGDVRSLPLLQAFGTSVELFQAADELSVGELRDRIRRRVDREPELVLSPAYFLSLKHKFPKISRVDIRPLRGHADNEMTRFRYSAILHIDHDDSAHIDGEFLDWTERKWGLDEIRSMLKQHPNQRIGLKGIRNARLEEDLAAMAILDGADAADTAGKLRQRLEQGADEGIHPQALLDLEAESLGFKVFLSLAASRSDGSYDACLIPAKEQKGTTSPAINWPEPAASAFAHFANVPGQARMRSELTDQLMAHCNQYLPQDSVPRKIILVDMLERNA